MPKLVLKFENSVLKEVPVGSSEVSIGRSPDNGLVIDNPAVSHYHARVFHEEGRLMLEDFGSLNGTFVNGQRVEWSTLAHGDEILVGRYRLHFARLEATSVETPAEVAENAAVPVGDLQA